MGRRRRWHADGQSRRAGAGGGTLAAWAGAGGPLTAWEGARRAVAGFDAAVDSGFERYLRGRPLADSLMYGASAVGDHGMLWLALALLQHARRQGRGERSRTRLVRMALTIGLESLVVNGPLKWAFRRGRPEVTGPRPRRLRLPRTSSFPSGHATSAFCAAALLRDGDRLWPLYYLAALVVAASRVHVRIHHPSDVAGGMVIGAVAGEVVRRAFPLSADPAAGRRRSVGGIGGPSAPLERT